MYLLSRILDKQLLEISCDYSTGLGDPTPTSLLNNYTALRGGVHTDYDVFYLSESSEQAQRIRKRVPDEFNLVWDDNKVIGVDFTPEDTKRHMRFVVQDALGNYTDTVKANGQDTLTVTATVMDHARTVVDTTFNATIKVPIHTPDHKVLDMEAVFVNGVCAIPFRTLNAGRWSIPMEKTIDGTNIKIGNDGYILDINATLVM